MADAVAANDLNAAQNALRELEKTNAPASAKAIARELLDTIKASPKPTPGDVPASFTQLALGNAKPELAEVGWLEPAANRVPPNNVILSPLLDSGKPYATGLYAHAPSRYVFSLVGKWKKLSGVAGLHTLHQPYGSGVFLIKTDGHEAFHSAVIRGAAKAGYQVDLTGVKQLELIVDPADDGNHNDWGLWLDPMLSR